MKKKAMCYLKLAHSSETQAYHRLFVLARGFVVKLVCDRKFSYQGHLPFSPFYV
jgi:hypothetical protein